VPRRTNAISYVWGNSAKTHSIIVDDSQLLVSANVCEILDQRTTIWSWRFLWIDAVCINQDDTKEKNERVRLMRRIYKTATQVTIFLGSALDAYDAQILRMKLALRIYFYSPSARHEAIMKPYYSQEDQQNRAVPKDWVALVRLFSNPWFERVWMVAYGGIYFDWGP
jgi:hypothetical protein